MPGITAHVRQVGEASLDYRGRPHLKIMGLKVLEHLPSLDKALGSVPVPPPLQQNKQKYPQRQKQS